MIRRFNSFRWCFDVYITLFIRSGLTFQNLPYFLKRRKYLVIDNIYWWDWLMTKTHLCLSFFLRNYKKSFSYLRLLEKSCLDERWKQERFIMFNSITILNMIKDIDNTTPMWSMLNFNNFITFWSYLFHIILSFHEISAAKI